MIRKTLNSILNALKSLSQLFPPWLTNPGLMSSVGREITIGLKDIDPDTAYDLLLSPSDIKASSFNKLRTRGARIINVQLSPSFFLETTHSFPKKVAGEIKVALALHIRQNTPFSEQDIVWRSQIINKDKKTVTAKQFIIKQQVLDTIYSVLSGAGLKVKYIQLENSRLVFLDRTHEVLPTQRFWRRVAQSAFLLAIIAIFAASYINFQARVGKLDQVTRETARLQDHAISLREAATAQQAEATQIASLLEQLNRDRQILNSLSSLTELLPDSTWLAQLTLRREGIRLAGFSTDDPSNLVIIIENSPQFRQVLLSGPVTRDQRLAQNRFEMVMSLEYTDE